MSRRIGNSKRSHTWNGDALRAEMAAAAEMTERCRAELRARISRKDPRASEDLHDDVLGESYFARLVSTSGLCDSPEKLREFLTNFKPRNVQFHSAYDERVARTAFREKLRELLQRAEEASTDRSVGEA